MKVTYYYYLIKLSMYIIFVSFKHVKSMITKYRYKKIRKHFRNMNV